VILSPLLTYCDSLHNVFIIESLSIVCNLAAVTETKQINNKKKLKNVNTIEIVSKRKYEQLERKYKRLVRSQDKTIQRVEDLEDTLKLIRWQDTCLKGFTFNYMKLRHKPKLSEDEEKELYSEDGKHYYPLHGLTLEPVNFTRDRFSKTFVKVVPSPSPFGFMSYNKPMNNDRYWQLEEEAEKIAGKKSQMNFSDPKEDEEFDHIGRLMA